MKEEHPEDLLIARLHVKSLLTLKEGESSGIFYEEFELRPILTQIREANRTLVEKHGYSKLLPHIDFFEISLCSNYLSSDEYGRLSRKYLGRSVPPHLQLEMRLILLARFDSLHDREQVEKHQRQLASLLDGDSYKQIRDGAAFKLALAKKKFDLFEQRNQGQECAAELEQLEVFVKTLGIEIEAEEVAVRKALLAQRFPDVAKTLNWDQTERSDLLDHAKKTFKPYLESGVTVPCHLKIDIVNRWFLQKPQSGDP